jgi:PAS domain S-box-containing protein
MDPTPCAFAVSGIAVAWGLFRYDLFDIVPAAHDIVIQGMVDGLIVLDASRRIVELNPAAERILGMQRELYVGRPLSGRGTPELRAAIEILDEASELADITIRRDQRSYHYAISRSPLHGERGHKAAEAIILRDITERIEAQQDRERLISELREALSQVKVLSGLLPICAWCKRIRTDDGYWAKLEEYLGAHSEAQFTHGICPECLGKLGEEPSPQTEAQAPRA